MMKYTIQFFTILIALSSIEITIAQPNSPKKWRVGYFGEIDFTGAYGVPLLSQDTIGTEFSNTIGSNSSGDIIIFSNGFNVYDSNMNILPGSPLVYDSTYLFNPSLYGSGLLYGSIIIPRPDYTNQFYIFHTVLRGQSSPYYFFGELYYSVIDRNLNNGLGAITTVNNILLDDTTWIGFLSAVRHGNGRDWWLVSGRNYSNSINAWLVQADTIIGPNSQPIGLPLISPQDLNQTQFSPDGSKIAIAYNEIPGNVSKFILADFNRCTGTLSNINIITIPNDGSGNGVSGVEFSESGRFLYASSAFNLYQFDLWSSNIQNSRLHVKLHDNFPSPFPSGFSSPKRGPDGKIYFATGNGNYGIDVVNYPDSLGIACDVQLRQINYFTQFGATYAMNILVMPNYPDYNLGPLVGSPCDTITGVVEYNDFANAFSIYPNPSGGSFTINFKSNKQEKVVFELLDIYGRVVFATLLQIDTITHQISLPETVANGVYVGRMVSEKSLVSGKMILKR